MLHLFRKYIEFPLVLRALKEIPLNGMWLRGEGSSYRTAEMQWEKQGQPGHASEGISTREGLFASQKEWEDRAFYILLSDISLCE